MIEQIKKDFPDSVTQGPHEEENKPMPSNNYREISYFVMFVGAVFIINAMETGSYRTPWPMAIITTLVGLGLFGYSLYLQSRLQ